MIENDTSSGELLQTIVPYSSDEFESPRANLSSAGNQVNHRDQISYGPNNYSNRVNRSDIISIEPVGYYSHGNTDCMNNRGENRTHGNNSILDNRETANRTDVNLATDNQCIDVTYWNPGFSSDEDMEMFEDQNQKKNAVIIGKPPSVSETSNKSTNKINPVGARGSNSFSTNNQNRTELNDKLGNRTKISDVTDSSGAVNKSTNKNYSQIQKEMLMEVDNLFCGLDSDTDEEKETGFNDAIIKEDICLPSLNYTRRSNQSRQNHIQNIGKQNSENAALNQNHANSHQNRQNYGLNPDSHHQYLKNSNHYAERCDGENGVNNKSQNVAQTDNSINVLENQNLRMYSSEKQKITDRQQTSNIFQVDFDDDFDQLDTELSPPRNQNNPDRGHTNTKNIFDLYKEESQKRLHSTDSSVLDQSDSHQSDNLTGQINPAFHQLDHLDLTNTAIAGIDSNKGQLLKVLQKSNVPDDFQDDWDCSQIIPQMSSSSRLQELYPVQDSKRCHYGNTSNINRLNHCKNMEQPFPRNQNKIIENTGMQNHTEVKSEYTANSTIPEKISVSRRKDVMNGPIYSLSSNLSAQTNKNISRNSSIKRSNEKPGTDLQYKEVEQSTTQPQGNHTSEDFIVPSKVHSKPKFNLKSVDYIYSDDDTSNTLKLSQHDRVLCQPVKHDQSKDRFQEMIPVIDSLADSNSRRVDVQINDRIGSKWNDSEWQSYQGDFNESFRSGSRSVGNNLGERDIDKTNARLPYKESPEKSFRANESLRTHGSIGDIVRRDYVMPRNDVAEHIDHFHQPPYKLSSHALEANKPPVNTSSEKSIYKDINTEISSDIYQAMEAQTSVSRQPQYRLSSSDDYQAKVPEISVSGEMAYRLTSTDDYQAKVPEIFVCRQPQYGLTSPDGYQAKVPEISGHGEMPYILTSTDDYKLTCYKDKDVNTSPINCSKEHRYGQVLAWVPDDGGSPRPTTLPLKSPVPPAYLSQSPPLINSERIMLTSDPVKPEIEKSVGLSSFFCPIVKVDDNNHDNFNNLFEGIF
ncbi:putative histone-lysine N-methyltransferase 1 [Patella vulgata]|uniref:putative histone-lysine N-methyltransferase 1 n=1 Tax=Patella vulgata TaxID=6465 RepID=UPI00217F3E7B|nr:putative histone-lysine N-methyltransferase 1 [Patella vulgata]